MKLLLYFIKRFQTQLFIVCELNIANEIEKVT